MIAYFPTPYEDEWWYSVLCRYYLTTGIKSYKEVKRILYGNDTAHMGTLFPNGMVARIVNQLPNELYDIREILLNHTPIKYFIRLYPKEEQEYIIRYLSEEGSYPMSNLWKNYKVQNWKPRYCPECIKEDDEPYYHLSHQIPMVSCCMKHRCRLKEIDVQHSERELNNKFMCLSRMRLDDTVEVATDTELLIASIVKEYLTLPLGAVPTHSNLITGLINAGYWKADKSLGISIDGKRLHKDLMDLYKDLAIQTFGRTIDKSLINKLKNFKVRLPEKYILIQGLLNMSAQILFGDRIGDNLEQKILDCSRKNKLQSIKSVSMDLGLLDWQVRAICKYYGIKPFWIEKNGNKYAAARTGVLRFTVDEEELREIRAEAERLGFKRVGDYVMECIKFARERDKYSPD